MLRGRVGSIVWWGFVVVLVVSSAGLGGCVAADGRVYALSPAVAVVEPTLQANKDFILRYFAALNQDKSAATVDAYISDEDQVLKDHISLFETAFPNYQLTAEEMVAEGDTVFVRTTFTGVHNGDLMGIAPTGKEVTIAIALTYRIENGKIVEHWMLADQLTMLQQLGVIPQ